MWQQLSFETTAEHVDRLSEQLTALGALSVTYVDAKDQPIFEPKPGEMLLWQDVVVLALFPGDFDMQPAEQFCLSEEVVANSQMSILEEQDWQRVCMDDFKPMQFGQRLWVCPSWCEPPAPEAVNIMLDPGLAFGTGTHPTTALCLEALDGLDLQGKTVIDYGCGSGVLAVAAKKLGARHVDAVDNDPQAIDATLANAEKNQVELETCLATDFSDACQADIIVANILSNILIELAPKLINHCQQTLILSGILPEQVKAVMAAFASHFTFLPVRKRDNWVCLFAKRS